MKKLLFITALISGLFIVSCTDDYNDLTEKSPLSKESAEVSRAPGVDTGGETGAPPIRKIAVTTAEEDTSSGTTKTDSK